MELAPDFNEFFELLNAHRVDRHYSRAQDSTMEHLKIHGGRAVTGTRGWRPGVPPGQAIGE
jgi:hypothetical protein